MESSEQITQGVRWAIGIDLDPCPNCGCPLSHDLRERPFCRGCQKRIKKLIDEANGGN